jgi:large subunit ribosomal protein L13
MKSTTSTTSTQRTVHLFDAQGKILGRLATEIATVLSGKDQVTFAPHIDGGASIVVINTDGVEVTGNKPNAKIYNRFSGYPGGITAISFKDQRKKDSRKLIWQAVYGMLPKNSLRDKMLTRLRLFRDGDYGQRKIDVTHK